MGFLIFIAVHVTEKQATAMGLPDIRVQGQSRPTFMIIAFRIKPTVPYSGS
jgi:hypothetical protein